MKENRNKAGLTFKVGAISLAFLIIGYETALFVYRATVLRIAEARDKPDTVFVFNTGERFATTPATPQYESAANRDNSNRYRNEKKHSDTVRRNAVHSGPVEAARELTRETESFPFNPNTVSVEDLKRLGFSEKQALSIDSYRKKGGRFRRRSDFAKSYVVADSVYRRLEKYISIPLTDINKADSSDFDALPGIGRWFAAKMVSYREELGAYSYKEQLMDIYRFDAEKFDAIKDLITCSPPESGFALWSLPAEELKKHPYIKSFRTAEAIVLYRDNNPKELWNIEGLANAGILSGENAARLSKCLITAPE